MPDLNQIEQTTRGLIKNVEDIYKGTLKTLDALKKSLHPSEPFGALSHTIMPKLVIAANEWQKIWSKGRPDFEATRKTIQSLNQQLAAATAAVSVPVRAHIQAAREIADIELRHLELQNAVADLNVDQIAAAERYISLQDQVSKSLKDQVEELKQAEIYEHINKVHVVEQATEMFVLATGLTKVVKWSSEYNQALISANSQLQFRNELLESGLTAQARTGASVNETSEMMRALTNVAFKTREEFDGILETSIRVSEGLGLSNDQTAKLARTAEILKQPFHDLADTMATILDRTRLTAAEAEAMFNTLGQSYIVIGGASRGALEVISRVESELKKRTGDVGNVQRLISSMAGTAQGGMIAQVFGLSPEALRSEGGVQTLIQRLASRVQQDTAGKSGIGRLQVLENISQQLTGGTMTVQALSQLAESVRAVNLQQFTRLTIEERWKNQITDTNAAVHRLIGSLEALLMKGFLPLIPAIRKAVNFAADLIGKFSGSTGGARASVAVVLSTAAFMFGRLAIAGYNAALAVIKLVGSINALAASAVRGSVAAEAGTVGGVVATAGTAVARGGIIGTVRTVAAAVMSFIPVILTWTIGLLGAAAGGILLGSLINMLIDKAGNAWANRGIDKTLRLSHATGIRSNFERDVANAIMQGPDAVREVYSRYGVAARAITGYNSNEQAQARLRTLQNQDVERAINRIASLAIINSQNVEAAKNLADLVKISREHLDVDRKANDEELAEFKRRREEAQKKAIEDEHAKMAVPAAPPSRKPMSTHEAAQSLWDSSYGIHGRGYGL